MPPPASRARPPPSTARAPPTTTTTAHAAPPSTTSTGSTPPSASAGLFPATGPSISYEDAAKLDAVERFLREGGDVNAHPEHYSWFGWRWTLLHFAALQQADDVARLLVARGADVGRVNANGETPLDVALMTGHCSDEMRKLLSRSP